MRVAAERREQAEVASLTREIAGLRARLAALVAQIRQLQHLFARL
ncbi:MAG: hypothetical protein DDT32_02199 [Syntrophomonadaceae bacterium]|nr:hypothetical protein [Bacillota bacterium]